MLILVEMLDRKTHNHAINMQNALGMLALGVLLMPLLHLLLPAHATTGTQVLGDTEFQLLVHPSAPKLPADRSAYHAMIQLQTVEGDKPIEAPYNIDITVISSDPSVLNVPEGKVSLLQGQSMVKVALITTDKAGVASITALAERVQSSTASITTYRMDSLEPTRLVVYAAPSSFIPDSQQTGSIYIQVLNSQGLPTASKNDISVDLSSSDPTIGRVQSYVVIPAGSSGITVDFVPQKKTGDTFIKASAPDLAPGELSVAVDGPVASKLVVEFAPEVIPAVNYYDAMMVVQLADNNNDPVKASRLTKVLLKSSDTSVVEVPQYVEIAAGKSYATTFVESKGKLGSATITASATGYGTGIETIDAVSISTAATNEQKQLQIYSLPSVLPPDNSEHNSLVVVFQDMDGNPYRQTGYLYQRIALTTSNTQIGDIASTAFTAKETYAIAKFKTKYAIGSTEITAALEGHEPAQMTLQVAGSGPAAVQLTQIPGVVEANNFESGSLVVSLLDHDGRPVSAQEDTLVYLSSSDPEITRVQASTIISAGETHAMALVHTTLRAGTTTITGAADGLGAGSTVFRTVGFTGSISEYHMGLYAIPMLPADGKEYEAVIVQLQDQNGLPVLAKSDVSVSLSSDSLNAGVVESTVTIPKGSSQVSARFTTSLIEDEQFKITGSSQGFKSVEVELGTSTQPLTIVNGSNLPPTATFGEELPISVDVYSVGLPVEGAVVTITGPNAEETQVTTDELGHAEGKYVSTLPGTNIIIIKANKPGYEEHQISTRTVLQHTVDISIKAETATGDTVSAQLKVIPPKGVKNSGAKTAGLISFENVNWGSYFITAPLQVKTSTATYEFLRWSDGSTDNERSWNVVADSTISAIYKAKYLLQVNDVNGLSTGSGFYEEGESATVSVSSTSISGAIIDKEFAGWTGSISSKSASTTVVMDGPKTITAVWSDSYLKVALIAAAIGGGGFFYYWKIFKPKKELQEKERAPDLDWYKS